MTIKVVKPFDMEELEARIRTILRRSPAEKTADWEGELRIQNLALDFVHKRVFLKGSEVHLSPTEYRLLTVLATHPGKVLTFRTLAQEIKGDSNNPRSHYYVRMYIKTLRKKLQDDPTNTTHPRYIFTEPEIGYRFADLRPLEDSEA